MIDADELGFRVEGHIHARLAALMQRIPLKSHIGYYKPFSLDVNEKVKFIPGEIDFIINFGSHWLPIEVKSGLDVSQDGELGQIEGAPHIAQINGAHFIIKVLLFLSAFASKTPSSLFARTAISGILGLTI